MRTKAELQQALDETQAVLGEREQQLASASSERDHLAERLARADAESEQHQRAGKERVERDRQLAGLLERAACTCEGEAWTCPRCAALELLSSG